MLLNVDMMLTSCVSFSTEVIMQYISHSEYMMREESADVVIKIEGFGQFITEELFEIKQKFGSLVLKGSTTYDANFGSPCSNQK